jgi:3-methyladenine DNA glycosylase/8-oxoguanine DNA glycosylase
VASTRGLAAPAGGLAAATHHPGVPAQDAELPRARARDLADPVRAGLIAGPNGADFARLLAIPEIGTWTVEVTALHGLGRLDVVPAGDLGYLKLIGRLTTGNPRAVADEDEVRGFFAPYAPYAGMAALYLIGSGSSRPAPRPGGTRSSAGSPRRAAA